MSYETPKLSEDLGNVLKGFLSQDLLLPHPTSVPNEHPMSSGHAGAWHWG